MDKFSNDDLIKQIKRYQHCIQQVDPPEGDPQRVLHYIHKLSKLPIKFDELEKTGIGKTINSLRKCNGSIAEEATLLVGKWKSIVKKQVEEEEAEVEDQPGADENNDPSVTPNGDFQADTEYKKAKSAREFSQKDSKSKGKKKSSHEKEDKVKVHLITLKKEDSNDRKRKHSSDEKDKHSKKEKYKKLEGNHAVERKYDPDSQHQPLATRIKEEPCSENDSADSNTNHKKRKDHEKKLQRKDHDKRHHKSSKHSHRDEKHHRHHPKSSHHDKKLISEDSGSNEHKTEKKSKSGLKTDNESKKDKSTSKKVSKVNSSDAGSSNRDADSCHDYGGENSDEAVANDFGSVLLGIPAAPTTPKKKSTSSRSSSYQDSPQTFSSPKPVNDIDKLCGNIKLEPLSKDLDIADISYSVGSDNNRDVFKAKVKTEGDKFREDSISPSYCSPKDKKSKLLISDDEMLSTMTTTKNQRTKVFSGSKLTMLKFPTLFELCVRVLQDNFDALEYTGGVPFDVLKPILEKVSVEQLYRFENFNPYLIGETDELWECHAKKHFRKVERQEFETWRDLYLRCVEEREEKLQSLTENISQSIANSVPVRKTKLAYVDAIVKPPRNVARSQAKHGTGQILVKRSSKEPQPSATAIQSVKERLAKEAAAPTAVQIPTKSNLLVKKKKAPLMQKTLRQIKGLKR